MAGTDAVVVADLFRNADISTEHSKHTKIFSVTAEVPCILHQWACPQMLPFFILAGIVVCCRIESFGGSCRSVKL